MTTIELLSIFQEKITPELRLNFEEQIRIDFVHNRPNYECYRDALAYVVKDEVIWTRNNVISYLVKQNLLNGNDNLNGLSDEFLNPLIITCLRRQLLKDHGDFNDYEDKLKFILESNRIFNFFRNYDIPDYGMFSGYPKTYQERKIFINFINKYEQIVDPNFDFRRSRINYSKSFESLKSEILFKLDITNYRKEIENEINSLNLLIEADLLKEYRLSCFYLFKHIVKNNLNFDEFLLSTDDPLIYYIVLFFKCHTLPNVKYLNFLEEFDFDKYKKELTLFNINQFQFVNSDITYAQMKNFNEQGLMILNGTDEYLNTIKTLIGNEISKRDFVIIFEAISGLRTHLNEIDNHSFESQVEKTLKKIAKRYIAIYNSIQSDELKEIFFPTLLEYLQSYKTDKLNSIRIAFLTDYIQKQFEGDIPSKSEYDKSLPTETFKKLQTNLSVPELAQLFNLLNELNPSIFSVKSEAELHRFINATFESKKSDKNGVSLQSLKTCFHKPDYKAVTFWEDNLHKMLRLNMKNK